MHPFRNLLLISLGRASSFGKDPSPRDWAMVWRMARQQAMTGVLYEGILHLPENQLPPEQILSQWKEATHRIADTYAVHERHTPELEAILERLGLHGCILKGTGLAHLYPIPERRACGDIDVWVGTHDSILKAFRDAGYDVYGVIYQEAKADIFPDTDVEIHFHASKMYNPFLNARLQKWLAANSPIRSDRTLTYPDARFNAVYCMSHMYRHYLEGGIGMRQMLDYYYILRNLSPSDRGPVLKTLKHLGMKRFTGAVMASVQFNFGLEEEYLLCPPDQKHGRRLVEDIIRMGNFGVMDRRNYSRDGESALARFHRKNRRVFSNLRYYPREVVWSPFARIRQYLWRMWKGYL